MSIDRIFIDESFSKQVFYGESFQKDIVIPNGSTLHITKWNASAVNHCCVGVMLYWQKGETDEELIFTNSGFVDINDLDLQYNADGGDKMLSIVLAHNNADLNGVGLCGSVKGFYS